MEQLTVTEAATKLGVSTRRVQAMVKAGKLPATRFGKAIAINEADLSLVTTYGKAGRPPKPKDESAVATGAAEAVTTAETPVTAAEPLTPKVKAKRAKKAAVAAPKEAKPKRAGKKGTTK